MRVPKPIGLQIRGNVCRAGEARPKGNSNGSLSPKVESRSNQEVTTLPEKSSSLQGECARMLAGKDTRQGGNQKKKKEDANLTDEGLDAASSYVFEDLSAFRSGFGSFDRSTILQIIVTAKVVCAQYFACQR